MANTTILRTLVEPELITRFCEIYKCQPLDLSYKQLGEIFFNMRPDFVAYDNRGEVLYIGEITVSGYLGRKGRNFHIGGVRKLAEVFTKFYLFNIEDNRKMIIQRIKQVHENIHLKNVSCHLVIPEKSKFVNALGYRNKLLETDIIELDLLPLTTSTEKTVTETLQNAKDEMK